MNFITASLLMVAFYGLLDVVGSRRKRQRHDEVVNGEVTYTPQVNDSIWCFFRVLHGAVFPVHHRGTSKSEPALLPISAP